MSPYPRSILTPQVGDNIDKGRDNRIRPTEINGAVVPAEGGRSRQSSGDENESGLKKKKKLLPRIGLGDDTLGIKSFASAEQAAVN